MVIYYFSWVRQKIGTNRQEISLPADITNIGQLCAYLCDLAPNYAAVLSDTEPLRFSCNRQFCAVNQIITDHDEIAIFPPVTGG